MIFKSRCVCVMQVFACVYLHGCTYTHVHWRRRLEFDVRNLLSLLWLNFESVSHWNKRLVTGQAGWPASYEDVLIPAAPHSNTTWQHIKLLHGYWGSKLMSSCFIGRQLYKCASVQIFLYSYSFTIICTNVKNI